MIDLIEQHRAEVHILCRKYHVKTLEVFGKSDQVVTLAGVKKLGHKPFHTYTMRQAIEEGFILDVLQSYTTYNTYFELLKNEKDSQGPYGKITRGKPPPR